MVLWGVNPNSQLLTRFKIKFSLVLNLKPSFSVPTYFNNNQLLEFCVFCPFKYVVFEMLVA